MTDGIELGCSGSELSLNGSLLFMRPDAQAQPRPCRRGVAPEARTSAGAPRRAALWLRNIEVFTDAASQVLIDLGVPRNCG